MFKWYNGLSKASLFEPSQRSLWRGDSLLEISLSSLLRGFKKGESSIFGGPSSLTPSLTFFSVLGFLFFCIFFLPTFFPLECSLRIRNIKSLRKNYVLPWVPSPLSLDCSVDFARSSTFLPPPLSHDFSSLTKFCILSLLLDFFCSSTSW